MEFGKTRNEASQMHPQTKALIHGWGTYPWIINFHEWGATSLLDLIFLLPGCFKGSHHRLIIAIPLRLRQSRDDDLVGTSSDGL